MEMNMNMNIEVLIRKHKLSLVDSDFNRFTLDDLIVIESLKSCLDELAGLRMENLDNKYIFYKENDTNEFLTIRGHNISMSDVNIIKFRNLKITHDIVSGVIQHLYNCDILEPSVVVSSDYYSSLCLEVKY